MISIQYFNGLPLEYESFLIKKYESFFTSCRYIEIYHPGNEINHVLITENGSLIEVLMFEKKGDTITCLNKLGTIEQNIISEFTKFIFERFPTVKKIRILASYTSYSLNKMVLLDRNNDYIINLHSTINDYMSELGYHTRKNVNNRKSRLLKDYPNVKFVTRYGIEIDESIVDKIIQLNIDRMKFKGIIPGKDNTDKINIYDFSRHYGVVTYIEIDGVVVAGNISYIVNKSIFGHVLAHDENFSKYNVSKLSLLYLIQTSIEKEITKFHFLWGDNDYKKKFLGEPNLLYYYVIYRYYSLDYGFNKIKVVFVSALKRFRLSKYSKPLRDAIKSYRRKKMTVIRETEIE